MKIPLSSRLLACCGFVQPGDRVADIGCDHGYLSLHLLQTGLARSVIAADVNQGPLDSAVANAVKFGVREKISFYLSDGFSNVPRDFDCAVCAGMGADTMIAILTAAPWIREAKYRLILQCQSKRPELRHWLSREGFRITRETLAKDGKFVYSILEAFYDPGHPLTAAQCYITPQLLIDRHPLLGEYYDRVMHGLELTVFGLERAGDSRLPEFQAIYADLKKLEEDIHDNRS